MNVRTSITRGGAIAIASLTLVAISAAPASAHYLDIKPPGGEPKTQWVGGPTLNQAKGKGLIPGGPTGEDLLSPAHGKGLNSACAALRANGNAAASIYGPPGQGVIDFLIGEGVLPEGTTQGCGHGEFVFPDPED